SAAGLQQSADHARPNLHPKAFALTPWRNRSGSLPPHWLPAREFQLGRLLCQPEHPVAIAHWREQVDAPLSFHEFAAYDFNCCLIPAEGVQHAFCQASTATCDSDALALTNAPHATVGRGHGGRTHRLPARAP